MPTPERPTLVLAIDGLRAAALGAYGQTAYETPALDRFAAEGVTHDWCYAPTPEPRELYERLAPKLDARTVVLTDDEAAVTPLVDAGLRVVTVAAPEADTVAASIEATTYAAVWSGFAEAIAELAAEGLPGLVWLHSRGLYGPWDAPITLVETLVDEDDPAIRPDVTPPDSEHDDASSPEACDARFAAGCRYAAQVMTLDACLAGWLDVVDGLFEGEDLRVIVAGLRGFPLGEHGRIGGVDPRLFSEQQQAPLLVRDPDPATRFIRHAPPTTLDDALTALLAGDPVTGGVARLESAAATALIKPDWMVRRPAGEDAAAELYVKPDDRWEQNDVASLEEATADELQAELADQTGVAATGRAG